MSADRLAAVLDRARWVAYNPDSPVLSWYGGHTVHVYTLSGEEVDCISVGDFAVHVAV